MSNETQNVQQQSGEADKVQKNFDATMRKLVAIMGGKKNLSAKKRVGKDVVANVVANLLQEKRSAVEKEVKDDLNDLLAKKVDFDKTLAEKKAELEKLKKTKQKEFIDAAQKIFQKIEGLDQLEKDYYTSLGTVQEE